MERSLARSKVYNLLSLCLSYPDDEIYACRADGKLFKEARKSLSLLADDHFDECFRAFEDVSCGREKATQLEMEREYARLFINAFSRIIPFHDSTGLKREELVSGETTSDILHFFREAGFAPNRGDMPGHIAHQFEFMAFLANQESKASPGGRIRLEEIQLNFLSRFIIPWVSAYCEKVKHESGLSFYCILGDLTREFISFEINYLGIPEEKEQQGKLI